MSLHDMDQMPDAVAESARVLARGGRLCLAIPHPVNSAGSFQARDGRRRSPSKAHIWIQPRTTG